MLILGRKYDEKVRIQVGDEVIWVTVVDLRPGSVRLGFEMSEAVVVDRQEIHYAKEADRELRRQQEQQQSEGGGR